MRVFFWPFLIVPFQARAEIRKVIEVCPIKTHQIEMPDGSTLNFGADYQASLLESLLSSQKYVVVEQASDFCSIDRYPKQIRYLKWMGSLTPIARLDIQTKAYSFETGARGERMFYGFNDRVFLPDELDHEEFPLRREGEPLNWFGASFDRKGVPPFDSQAGLDLGETWKLSLPFSTLALKYQRYYSNLHLLIKIELPYENHSIEKEVRVKGRGFFLDLIGSYDSFSLGVSFARKDAMQQALSQAIKGSLEVIHQALKKVRRVIQVDVVMKDGQILLGTGSSFELPKKRRFRSMEDPSLLIEIQSSGPSGSVGRIISGSLEALKPGMLFGEEEIVPRIRFATREGFPNRFSDETQTEIVELPDEKLLATWKEDYLQEKKIWNDLATRLMTSLSLPYRFWRYFRYDRPYQSRPDKKNLKRSFVDETWASQIGLEKASPMSQRQIPLIAVIDSGMDYNSSRLHSSLWLNPSPKTDLRGHQDRYGWDFISNDSRPDDDGFHGTQVASLIHAVAPYATLMPLKIFNAWGITRSAALYSALVYAVDHGAQVILCAWKTEVPSVALEKGLQYAFTHQVIVVTPAGEEGHLSYPGDFSGDLLLRVSAVDSQDQLLSRERKNFDLAAPGLNLRVLEPRSREGFATGGDYASALVAGGLLRVISSQPHMSELDPKAWINLLLSQAKPILQNKGLRLQIR